MPWQPSGTTWPSTQTGWTRSRSVWDGSKSSCASHVSPPCDLIAGSAAVGRWRRAAVLHTFVSQISAVKGDDVTDSLLDTLGLKKTLSADERSQLANIIDDWRHDPFKPHLIARQRIAAYRSG